MGGLRIYTNTTSRYLALDLSGKHPFSICFGICRRSPEDTDPRSLVVNATNSVLDVPYALRNELLTLAMYDEEKKRESHVDVSRLSITDSKVDSYLTLSSPVGRTKNWKFCLSYYQYHIDPASELGLLLETGRRYSLRMKAGVDFGGKGWRYVDEGEPLEHQTPSSTSSESLRLVVTRADGRAMFWTVSSVPWPPSIQTQMRRCRNEGDNDEATILEITVVNTGSEAITVQTSGGQKFLAPRLPFGGEENFPEIDLRARLINEVPSPGAAIRIFDPVTNAVVRETDKSHICVLYDPKKHDPRPMLKNTVTLTPDEPLVRRLDVSRLLSKLPDGKYGLLMEPRGMWWCPGCRENFETEDEDRIPHHLYKTHIPPLMLETEDVVEVQVEDGIVK